MTHLTSIGRKSIHLAALCVVAGEKSSSRVVGVGNLRPVGSGARLFLCSILSLSQKLLRSPFNTAHKTSCGRAVKKSKYLQNRADVSRMVWTGIQLEPRSQAPWVYPVDMLISNETQNQHPNQRMRGQISSVIFNQMKGHTRRVAC